MAKLIYVQGSPRMERSKSNTIAAEFLNAYKTANPNDEILKINVFEKNLPTFDGFTIGAKYAIMHGNEHTEEEAKAWKWVTELTDEFKSGDKYLFSVPMWNFGIPYRLKQYIDIITQPGYTFDVDKAGNYNGLVAGNPAMVIFARGGDYRNTETEKQIDHQKSYIQLLLGFIGFTDIQTVTAQPMLAGGPDIAKENVDKAVEQAKKIASEF